MVPRSMLTTTWKDSTFSFSSICAQEEKPARSNNVKNLLSSFISLPQSHTHTHRHTHTQTHHNRVVEREDVRNVANLKGRRRTVDFMRAPLALQACKPGSNTKKKYKDTDTHTRTDTCELARRGCKADEVRDCSRNVEEQNVRGTRVHRMGFTGAFALFVLVLAA
jgi:hypothetical protein